MTVTVVDEAPARPPSALSDLAPRTARNLGTYVNPDPDWAVKGANITDDGGMVMDVAGRRALVFGGSHGPSQETDIRSLSLNTLQWSSLYPSTPWAAMTGTNMDPTVTVGGPNSQGIGRYRSTNHPIARHTYSLTEVIGARMYCFQAYCNPNAQVGVPPMPEGSLPNIHGRICWYDFDTKQWGFSQHRHSDKWLHASASCLDPVSGYVYIVGLRAADAKPGPIWRYEWKTDTLTAGPMMPTIASQPLNLVHCPADDSFWLFERNGAVQKVNIDRTNFARTTATPIVTTGTKPRERRPRGYPSMAWEGAQFGGSFIDGFHYQFDPRSSAWTATPIASEGGRGPASNDFAASDWDPVEGVYIAAQIHPTLGPTSWAIRP
jgi:hypothetical protein